MNTQNLTNIINIYPVRFTGRERSPLPPRRPDSIGILPGVAVPARRDSGPSKAKLTSILKSHLAAKQTHFEPI